MEMAIFFQTALQYSSLSVYRVQPAVTNGSFYILIFYHLTQLEHRNTVEACKRYATVKRLSNRHLAGRFKITPRPSIYIYIITLLLIINIISTIISVVQFPIPFRDHGYHQNSTDGFMDIYMYEFLKAHEKIAIRRRVSLSHCRTPMQSFAGAGEYLSYVFAWKG